jgi:hypothetical protein
LVLIIPMPGLPKLGSVANLADQTAWCTFTDNGFGGEQVMIEFKGSHFERDVILWAVRWYLAERDERMMKLRGKISGGFRS